MISCNHAISALGRITLCKPQWQEIIYNELLSITKDNFKTDDCKAIAIGKVLDVLKPIITNKNASMIYFITEAAVSPRNSTRKKAELLLRKIQKL